MNKDTINNKITTKMNVKDNLINAIAKRQINILAKDTNIIGITKLDKTKLK